MEFYIKIFRVFVLDYSIDYNEAAGYDMDTLLPRQLKINL
jgi:hypothetical protein